jgi:epoxyqueuosine reductase
MTPSQLSQSIKSAADHAGFDWCGICPAVQPGQLSLFHEWLESGYHGEMDYLLERKQAYSHPRFVMDGAKSVVMLAAGYKTATARPAHQGQGKVSRYAWGSADYHDVIHSRLKLLKKAILELQPQANVRGVIDTAPLLEREFATLAGLGWQGKNTLVISKHSGSLFFLAAILLDFAVQYDQPHHSDHCGTCRACLDACPTDAFVKPNVLDATRCISYLTIELRKPIPVSLREPMGDWVFGCDVCQDVCPWNSKSKETDTVAFQPAEKMNPFELIELFDLTDDQFRARFRKTPLWRSRRRGILRNAAIVLGNQRDASAINALEKGINDPEALVRGASAWALGRIGNERSLQLLNDRKLIESDTEVREEIERFL